MSMQIYIDGEFVEESEAKISVFDHGLLYGDGIFEGIRLYSGRVFCLEEHIDRLFQSARAILLEIPMSAEELVELVIKTIRANGLQDGYVRVLVTRGKGSLGLSPYLCPKATVVIIADKITLFPEECYTDGLRLITCATRRSTPGALPPQVKSLNYLNNVMAKVEALQAGAQEAVMLNEQGYVAECSGDNLFIVKGGELITPPVSAGALDGITRRVVMEIAASLGVVVREAMMTRFEIFTAEECFVTGTAAEVVPVVMLDQRPLGNGRPGPVTKRIIENYHQRTKVTGTPV